ncbi:hypothetical protein [Bacillus pinisoli]|uniref:hypothetical protein n=1 Tax=Bacillus pinisoli TaxID=2901866 RepID=UPI001FF4CC52|nr:hypothetical protein [Bacillus pinisoli]
MIYSQPYIKIERQIIRLEQKQIKRTEFMELYEDKIVTASKTFKLRDVYDVSYREMSDEYGFLYLHTNQGVFPYYVESIPDCFMQHYVNMTSM